MKNKWNYISEEIFELLFTENNLNELFFEAWRERRNDNFLSIGRFVISKDGYDFYNVFDIESGNAIAFQFNHGLFVSDAYSTTEPAELRDFFKHLNDELQAFCKPNQEGEDE